MAKTACFRRSVCSCRRTFLIRKGAANLAVFFTKPTCVDPMDTPVQWPVIDAVDTCAPTRRAPHRDLLRAPAAGRFHVVPLLHAGSLRGIRLTLPFSSLLLRGRSDRSHILVHRAFQPGSHVGADTVSPKSRPWDAHAQSRALHVRRRRKSLRCNPSTSRPDRKIAVRDVPEQCSPESDRSTTRRSIERGRPGR